MNTEERLFQISSSPSLTCLQNTRAGLGLIKCRGLGLSLVPRGAMVVVVVVVVVVLV